MSIRTNVDPSLLETLSEAGEESTMQIIETNQSEVSTKKTKTKKSEMKEICCGAKKFGSLRDIHDLFTQNRETKVYLVKERNDKGDLKNIFYTQCSKTAQEGRDFCHIHMKTSLHIQTIMDDDSCEILNSNNYLGHPSMLKAGERGSKPRELKKSEYRFESVDDPILRVLTHKNFRGQITLRGFAIKILQEIDSRHDFDDEFVCEYVLRILSHKNNQIREDLEKCASEIFKRHEHRSLMNQHQIQNDDEAQSFEQIHTNETDNISDVSSLTEGGVEEKVEKKRGRPKKTTETNVHIETTTIPVETKPRGRPRKVVQIESTEGAGAAAPVNIVSEDRPIRSKSVDTKKKKKNQKKKRSTETEDSSEAEMESNQEEITEEMNHYSQQLQHVFDELPQIEEDEEEETLGLKNQITLENVYSFYESTMNVMKELEDDDGEVGAECCGKLIQLHDSTHAIFKRKQNFYIVLQKIKYMKNKTYYYCELNNKVFDTYMRHVGTYHRDSTTKIGFTIHFF